MTSAGRQQEHAINDDWNVMLQPIGIRRRHAHRTRARMQTSSHRHEILPQDRIVALRDSLMSEHTSNNLYQQAGNRIMTLGDSLMS